MDNARDVPSLRSRLEGLAGDADLTGLELLRRVSRVANLYDTILKQRLRSTELSGPRWHLLVRLFAEEMRHGPGGLSPTYLSKCQDVSKNTISALLRGLEEQGLIERALDPGDRRGFRIRLSATGRDMVRAMAPLHFQELNELVAGLSAADRATLIALLDKLQRSLVEHSGPALPGARAAWEDGAAVSVSEGERNGD